MGLTLLAIGMSIPEMVSSIAVARQSSSRVSKTKKQTAQNHYIIDLFHSGQGTMALCTALSSSTFDVLICLGIPWFIKAMWFHKANSSASLNIHSRSLDDSAIAVMISTIGFMLLMYGKKFILTKRVRIVVFTIFVFIIIFF